MQNAEDRSVSARSDDRNDGFGSIVSDLVSLIEHVQASMNLIESAIEMESPLGGQEVAANVVVLDDVTPRYQNAGAALNTCKAALGAALDLLLDTKTSKYGTDEAAGCDLRSARSIGRA